MKKIFSLFLALMCVMVFISCGKNVDWTDNNGYQDAKKLESSHVESNNKLVMNISNKDNYLKNITKDMIIVKERKTIENDNEQALTTAELKADNIKDYELEVGEKEIKITLPEYKESLYMVVFNKALTNDNKYAYAYFSLLNEKEFVDQPYVKIIENKYIAGDEDPLFSINYYNMEIADKSKMTFGEGFNGLSSIRVIDGDNQISIATDGVIGNADYGTITLNSGFFKNIDYEVDLYFDIDFVAFHIDSSSLKYENNILSFNVVFSNRHFENTEDINVTFGDYEIENLEIVGNNDTIKVSIRYSGDINDAIGDLFGLKLKISSSTKNIEDEMMFNIYRPEFYAYATMVDKELTLNYRYYDVIVGNITEDLIEIESDILSFEDNGNAKIKSFTERSNGFDLTIELNDLMDVAFGNVKIKPTAGLFKTLWGEEVNASDCLFECLQERKVVLTATGEYDESFTEKMITASPDIDTFAHVLMFVGYAAQFGASVYSGNPASAIGSVLSMLQLFGLTGKSGEPTIQDVLNKLEDMANQLKSIDRKIDSLKQEVLDQAVATQLGIDKILFNQYRMAWEDFYQSYIEKLDTYLWSYTTDIRTYFVNFVMNNEDVTLELKYFTKDNENVFSLESPNFPGSSVEGYPYATSKDVIIKKMYFTEVQDLVRKAQGYSDDFDATFRKCLKAYLEAENPTITEEELNSLINDIYAQITGQAQFETVSGDVNVNRAKDITISFINFAKQLSGKATGTSKMTYYFKMLESLYNFQSEAKDEILQFRVNMKRLLDQYAAFATSMAQFCPGINKKDITDAYVDAYNYIKDNTNLRTVNDGEEYCYPINSKISCKAVRCSFDKGYDNSGHNNCTFWCYYRTYDEQTDNTVDVVNNSKLLSNANLGIINARALNILRTNGISTDNYNFYSYLRERNIITKAIRDKYSGSDVITSYAGINSLSNSNVNLLCTSYGVGDYFEYGTRYKYKGSREGNCWSAREATGNIYNLNSNTQIDSIIDILGQYDESHWYWSTDEHWGFELYMTGRTALVFIRV